MLVAAVGIAVVVEAGIAVEADIAVAAVADTAVGEEVDCTVSFAAEAGTGCTNLGLDVGSLTS